MIRLGMIGCGRMAGFYLKQMEAFMDRMRFTGFADLAIERAREAEAVSAIGRGAKVACDYREILDEAERRGEIADLRGLGLDAAILEPDPYLAETKKWGYTVDLKALGGVRA